MDFVDIADALSAAQQATEGGVDVIEIGTPLIKRHGLAAVETIRHAFPSVPIYADSKMVDFPKHEIADFFEAGASFVSAMLIANDENVTASLRIAKNYRGDIAFSTMGYPLPLLKQRVAEIVALGGRYFVAHGSGSLTTAFREVTERLKILTQIDGLEVVIGGGLTKGNISRVLLHRPKILIVGRAISSAGDITLATRDIKDLITNVATRGEKR